MTRLRSLFSTAILLWGLSASAAEVEYVIHISVDGLRGDLLADLLATDTSDRYANFQRFIDEGATTLNARTDYTHTNTLPNHTSMLSGRPVLQPAGQPATVHHGYVSNSTPRQNDTLHNRGNPNVSYIASVFDVVHDNGLTTALFASKSKFIIYEQSYNAANGAPDPEAPDYGFDKIDRYTNLSTGSPANGSGMHSVFISEMTTKPFDYAFVHYRDPDTAGHAFGWGSSPWDAAVGAVDGYLAGIFAMVEGTTELAGRTAIILTADHGGVSVGHGDAGSVLNYTIPFLVWGPGVEAGADLYALNRGRRADPGLGRPDYNASPPPIRNGDSGNLALEFLGLPAVPGSTINGAQNLSVGIETAAERSTWSSLKGAFR